MIQQFDSLDDFNNLIDNVSDKYIVIDFSASWCIPCKKVYPEYEKLSEQDEYIKNCYFYKVDVDELSDLSEHLGVSRMPTFLIYYNKEKVYEMTGTKLSNIETFLSEAISSS
tara:strand:+ start:50 stop:385 length:336 start_codon:yes stop_codon:yes gene_type:complete